METLIEKMKIDAEDYGQYHGEFCPVNMEDPDECDCEEMKFVKQFTEEWMGKVNEWWVEMAKAHRPHCTPSGNKLLTAMMGKKNRNLKK
jgi:hypothetical protein